jgi:hypothetical protein
MYKNQELDKIRSVFPNWPSELDVAKTSSNWAIMAQYFYCAAKVLNDEFESTRKKLHSNSGQKMTNDILIRLEVNIPSIFCLAFSLELVIKAARIKQGDINDLENGDKIPFASHSVGKMAKEIYNLNITPEEDEWLKQTARLITNGKYPVGIKPKSNINGILIYPTFNDFNMGTKFLYERLMKIATT